MDDNFMVINELERKVEDHFLEKFEKELTKLINKYGIDNYIGLPDYILSKSFTEQLISKEIYFMRKR